MSKIAIVRTDNAMPDQRALDGARALLFGALDGFSREDKSAWRRFWKRLLRLQPGEMAQAEMVFPRSGPFHRRHMKIEQLVFDAQERFQSFEQLRNWLKLGAGHCDWVPGPKGAIVPIPKSVSYASMDDEEFRQFHLAVIGFLRTVHAGKALWPHLDEVKRSEMIEAILAEFNE